MQKWISGIIVALLLSVGVLQAAPINQTPLVPRTLRSTDRVPMGFAGNDTAYTLSMGQVLAYVFDNQTGAHGVGGGGSGDMLAATYDPAAVHANVYARANHTGTQAATTITGLATVATSGSYLDLSNRPTIPAALSDLTGDSTHRVVTDAQTASWTAKQAALVAGSDYLTPTGSAAGLTNFPTLNQNTTGTAANLSGTPALPDGTTATTQTLGDNTTKIATTAFVLANTGASLTTSTPTSFASGTLLGSTGTALRAGTSSDITTLLGYTPLNPTNNLSEVTASTARANLGLAIGTNVQAYNANLSTYAGIAPSANAQTLLGHTFTQMVSDLGLVIGTNTQAYSANLGTYAGIAPSANAQTLLGHTFAQMATDIGALTNPMTTAGDLILGGASGTPARLAAITGLVKGTGTTYSAALSSDLTTLLGYTPLNPANNLSDVTAATARTNLGLAIGTNVQAYNANLSTYAGIAPSANAQTLLGHTFSQMATDIGALANPMTTAGDLIVGGASGTPARVAAITGLVKGNGTTYAAAVSGTDVKTVGGVSLLGSGDVSVLTNPMTTAGDLIVGGTAGAASRLAKGADGTFLTMVAGAQSWGNTLVAPVITGYSETPYTPTVTAGAVTINLANGTIQKVVTAANTVITLPAAAAGTSYTILVSYGGSHTITWAGGGTLKFAGGAAPIGTAVSGKVDIYTFVCHDSTTTYGGDGGRNY